MRQLIKNPTVFLLASLGFVLGMNLFLNTQFSNGLRAEAATSASNVLLEKGIRELEERDLAEAILLFEQAVIANPRNARAFSYLGRGYDVAGVPARAYKYYGIALEIEPNDLKALSWSGAVDAASNRPDMAAEKLTRLERLCGRSCDEYQALKSAIDEADPPRAED